MLLFHVFILTIKEVRGQTGVFENSLILFYLKLILTDIVSLTPYTLRRYTRTLWYLLCVVL